MTELNLTAEFPDPTLADWKAKVEAGLRDLEFTDLVRQTEDDITRGPLMTRQDRPADPASPARIDAPGLDGRPWHITAPVTGPELAHANTQMLEDLKGGASAVRITVSPSGLCLCGRGDVKRLFDQVYTDLIPIRMAPGSVDALALDALLSAKDLHSAHVTLGLDPVAQGDLIEQFIDAIPKPWRILTINSAAIHNSGGTPAQELAVMAAYIVRTMNSLGPKRAHGHLNIEMTAEQDAHQMIAKIRAARRIYTRIAQSYGLSDTAVPIHVVTSRRMMQSTDPWTNFLRVMSAGFGAVCGGADYVTTLPFTDALGHATPFGHRMARNMQIMMMKESHLGQVRDPAFGSYFHETLTDNLAQAAWSKFQAIEALGGVEPYLDGRQFKDDLATALEEREDRADPILGVTLHPAKETRPAKIRKPKS